MRIETIYWFVRTVNEGSINKAAQQLHMNHQNLGKAISSLEAEIGLPLLERGKHGITLTEDGRRAYDTFREMLGQYQSLQAYVDNVKAVRSSVAGDVAIYHTSTMLPAKLALTFTTFSKHFPDLSLGIYESPSGRALQAVAENEHAIANVVLPVSITDAELAKRGYRVELDRTLQVTFYQPLAHQSSQFSGGVDVYTLLEQPLTIYSSYDVQENDLYLLLRNYGLPTIKNQVNNLTIFDRLMETCKYNTIGLQFQSALTDYSLRGTLFDGHHFQSIPVLHKGRPLSMRTLWVSKLGVQLTEAERYFLKLV